MAAIEVKSNVVYARVFAPKEEGWSETINISFKDKFQGYVVDQNGIKQLEEVDNVSFFTSAVIKALASTDANVGAFLGAKNHDQKLALLPILLADAHIELTREQNEDEQKIFSTITKIVVSDVNKQRVERALDQLFGF